MNFTHIFYKKYISSESIDKKLNAPYDITCQICI